MEAGSDGQIPVARPRNRVLGDRWRRLSRQSASRFNVSAASAIRWNALLRQRGDASPRPQGGDHRSHRIEAHAATILGLLESKRDITLAELKQALAERELAFGVTTLWRFFKRHRIAEKRMARPVCKGEFGWRAGLHQRIRSQGVSPGQDGFRAPRAS